MANAISVLNVGKSKQPDENDVTWRSRPVRPRISEARGRLASSSAVLYLCSVTLLKDLALFDDCPTGPRPSKATRTNWFRRGENGLPTNTAQQLLRSSWLWGGGLAFRDRLRRAEDSPTHNR